MGEGNKGTRPDRVTKRSAMHENKEKAGKKEMYVCACPKT